MKELKRPASRMAQYEEELDETPRILSSEEKREMILAHARSQTGKDPLQRMTVWGGVMIAVCGIAVGWWWTVGTTLHGSVQKGSPEYQAMTENLNEFTKTIRQEQDSLRKSTLPTNSANAGEPSGLMKALLEGDGRKVQRNDLLAPHPTGAVQTSTSTDTDTDTPTQLIDPAEPGLTPDQQ